MGAYRSMKSTLFQSIFCTNYALLMIALKSVLLGCLRTVSSKYPRQAPRQRLPSITEPLAGLPSFPLGCRTHDSQSL
jgi:hypothetical protein